MRNRIDGIVFNRVDIREGISFNKLFRRDFVEFINDKIPGAVKNRGIYSKTPEEEEAEFSFERSTLGKRPIKPITDDDIEIVELPQTFSRADLARLEESKAAMRRDSDEYVAKKLTEKESGLGDTEEVEPKTEEKVD